MDTPENPETVDPDNESSRGAVGDDSGLTDPFDADVQTSSDAEIIEAEAGLETAAAPTGEADWFDTATGPTRSVMSSRDAVDHAAAKEPVAEAEEPVAEAEEPVAEAEDPA